MKVLVDEDRLEDQDVITLRMVYYECQAVFDEIPGRS